VYLRIAPPINGATRTARLNTAKNSPLTLPTFACIVKFSIKILSEILVIL
jgi:hypothetical protein